MAAETRTEFGVRLEDGMVWPRDSREAAETSVHAIHSRGGESALMVRQITTTDWTEAEEEADA